MGFEVPSDAPKSVIGLVLSAARDAKHRLTLDSEVTLELPRKGGGDVAVVLTRAEFDALIAPLLERSGRAARRALRDAALEPGALDGVILVGGATRVPRVQSYVAELFGQKPMCDIDPDLVVAYGAALQADQLGRDAGDTLLLDVLPLSLGVETMGGAVDRILPRNTTIPVTAKTTFTTYADNQTGFELHIVQGERELAQDCRSLARFTLKGIPPLPAGQARLEVSFNVDENALLKVHARELATGIEQEVEVKPSYGLTDEQVEQMLMDALDHGEEDFEQRRLAEAKVEGSRVLAATQKGLLVDADLLKQPERDEITRAITLLQHSLEPDTGPGTASRIQALTLALDDATHAWAGRRMDRAFKSALQGQDVARLAQTVQHARGVDAHLEEHKKGSI
jgi:molecular chaperone HscA